MKVLAKPRTQLVRLRIEMQPVSDPLDLQSKTRYVILKNTLDNLNKQRFHESKKPANHFHLF